MSFELKRLSAAGVPGALSKAERYRLLNEPAEAESICRDVLALEPDNQTAHVILVLALSDQIGWNPRAVHHAKEAIAQLKSAYDRTYYTGILYERRAKGRHRQGGHGAGHFVHDWMHQAMAHFEEAGTLAGPGNDDPILRWNTCARFLMDHPEVEPAVHDAPEPVMSE